MDFSTKLSPALAQHATGCCHLNPYLARAVPNVGLEAAFSQHSNPLRKMPQTSSTQLCVPVLSLEISAHFLSLNSKESQKGGTLGGPFHVLRAAHTRASPLAPPHTPRSAVRAAGSWYWAVVLGNWGSCGELGKLLGQLRGAGAVKELRW